MGLDWNPIGRPKAGAEAEFEKLFNQLNGRPSGEGWFAKLKFALRQSSREAVTARWLDLQISPFDTVAAPQVGRDAVADAWIRERFRENPPAGKTEEAFLADMHGLYLVILAPPCDGIPYYSNGSPGGYVEPFSFRAQFIKLVCKEVVGEALLAKCYESCLAPGLAQLGAELRACVSAYAAQHGVAHMEHAPECDAEEDDPAAKAHILFAAAKWCEYWSSRGHGLDAYF